MLRFNECTSDWKKKKYETFSRLVSAMGKQLSDNQRWRKEGKEARERRRGEER